MLFLDNCGGLGTLVKLIKLVLERGVILIGVVLVFLIIIDLVKAIISGDEKEVKSAQKAAIRRGIYALVLFFVPTIVNLLFGLLGDVFKGSNEGPEQDPTSWFECWKNPTGGN